MALSADSHEGETLKADYTRRSCCDAWADGGSIPPTSTISPAGTRQDLQGLRASQLDGKVGAETPTVLDSLSPEKSLFVDFGVEIEVELLVM